MTIMNIFPLTTALKIGRKLYVIVTERKENEIEFEGLTK